MAATDWKQIWAPLHAPDNTSSSFSLIHCRLGRTRFFEARPAAVHFSGFEVGRKLSVKLEVLNISEMGQRLYLVVPQSPQFRVRKFAKKGQIAPGMVYHSACLIFQFGNNVRATGRAIFHRFYARPVEILLRNCAFDFRAWGNTGCSHPCVPSDESNVFTNRD